MKITLYHRFVIPISFLLFLLVAAILVIVEKREVHILYEHEETVGRTIADSLASNNLRWITGWDWTTVRDNASRYVDDRLVYFVFYDRNGNPMALSDSVRDRNEISCCPAVGAEAKPDTVVARSLRVRLGDRAREVLQIELPIFVGDSPDTPIRWGSIKIGRSLEPMRAEVARIRSILIVLGLGGLALGVLASVLLAKRVTRPVKELAAGAVRISRGDFSGRVPPSSRDEIGDLARRFNEMTDDLVQARERMEAANRRLVQAEKLASIGKLSATIAHEIRNPLTSVKLNIQKVGENEDLDETDREHISICREGITQIEKFIKELLDFTRASELQRERFALSQILDESLKVLQEPLRQKGLTVTRSYREGAGPVVVDGDKMRQVFLNVLRNAQEAVEPGGRIEIAVEEYAEGRDRRRRHRVLISDDGCGIPEGRRESIFEPFFTTKASGFGLGLANARKIVEQHQGAIRAEARPGKGSVFVIVLPAEEESA